jgi:5'-deoxynucleotidase YfbR-like HD superfamily hydrolase
MDWSQVLTIVSSVVGSVVGSITVPFFASHFAARQKIKEEKRLNKKLVYYSLLSLFKSFLKDGNKEEQREFLNTYYKSLVDCSKIIGDLVSLILKLMTEGEYKNSDEIKKNFSLLVNHIRKDLGEECLEKEVVITFV